jgi:hypothetical protein
MEDGERKTVSDFTEDPATQISKLRKQLVKPSPKEQRKEEPMKPHSK